MVFEKGVGMLGEFKEFEEFIEEIKEEPKYYHTKFFKKEGNIALVKDSFSKNYDFVEVI